MESPRNKNVKMENQESRIQNLEIQKEEDRKGNQLLKDQILVPFCLSFLLPLLTFGKTENGKKKKEITELFSLLFSCLTCIYIGHFLRPVTINREKTGN